MPDPRRAAEKYRARAQGYDASAQATMAVRRRAVALLALRPGDAVLDVACGTGLSFELLVAGVGPSGRVSGLELSPEMMAVARERVRRHGWTNVSLVEAAAEDAELDGPFDAVLFHYTHDVLQSPQALRRILRALKPGARVALAGIKYPSAWLLPAWLYRLAKARPYVTTYRGLRRPWRGLQPFLESLHVEPVMLGTNYVASGRLHG
jgi:demethylmenaquinone methyltransferase/2-methoxy-6-polyprenyl-1,4-benzoquinol methylase